jgi:ribosomal-protein-alanine N-acetyltransferase
LLEGKLVNLRIWEKEDMKLIAEWTNNPDFFDEFELLMQVSRTDMEKLYDTFPPETRYFFIEKKDGTKVGTIGHYQVGKLLEIGYVLVPSERRKGYCSEAAQIMVDYLFLSKDIVRIQAHTNVRNVGSQKILEKTGFKKEGVVRKSNFVRGEWTDACLYSILREEWKEPKILRRSKQDPVCY